MAKRRRQRKGSFSNKTPDPIVNIAERRSRRESLESHRKPSVLIAVPTLSGRTHYTISLMFGRSMASSMLDECPFRFQVQIEPGKRGIDYARNCIVRKFMEETDNDWLLMIDEDETVPENFWELCAVSDADIISAVTHVWVNNMDAESMLRVNHYGLNEKGQCYNLPTPDKSLKQPFRVPIVGTGCIAIRRRVFAPKPQGLGLRAFYFTRDKDQKIMAGEDINFSVDANKAGFILAVHPGVRFDHVKEIPLGQIEEYTRAVMEMESAGRKTTDAQRLSIG